MKHIQYIPKEFHDIELGHGKGKQTVCTPKFEGEIPTNTIAINTPQRIIYSIKNEVFAPVIPVCIDYMVSERRELKYNHLAYKILHIKKVGEATIYSGQIKDKDQDLIILPPGYYLELERTKERVKEAQKYSDEELDEGLAVGGYKNIDLMEYVDIALESGKYEIYLSFCGLESNHTVVEIVMK